MGLNRTNAKENAMNETTNVEDRVVGRVLAMAGSSFLGGCSLLITQAKDKSLTRLVLAGPPTNGVGIMFGVPAFTDGREAKIVEAIERLADALNAFAREHAGKVDEAGVFRDPHARLQNPTIS